VVKCVLQAAEQAGVLCKVVRAQSQKLGQFCDYRAVLVLDQRTIAGRARVAARSTVAVGVNPATLGGSLVG